MQVASLKDVSVHFGTDTVLDHADLIISAGERVCLAGRNGSGKSTLLRLLDGRIQADGGEVWVADGLTCATLEQELPVKLGTVFEVVAGAFPQLATALMAYQTLSITASSDADLRQLEKLQHTIEAQDGWSVRSRVEPTLQKLELDPDARLENMSGGWLKRVAIARSLVTEPDIWLMDEPTNHLDIPAVEWLQKLMQEFPGTIVFVSHDREMMQHVATVMVGIDRGRLKRWECDYQTFIERRDHELEVEAEQNKKFDDKLRKEETWIREGIKARRTRNEGRVRALLKLREERKARRSTGSLRLEVDAGSASGKIVKELTGVSKSLGGRQLIDQLDLIIQRGDRIGLLGPNGVGKSTLIKLILGEMAPDAGQIKTGTKLDIAYFDQVRGQLDPEKSVKDYIGEGRDFIHVNGRDTHVMSYLGNFMFDADQVRSPVRKLSGGEQNRLLLARLFSMPTNFLVLDEPTNDLDVESLELLEELLAEYTGTVLLVSHDRTFLDHVVSSLLVFEGEGRVTEYIGGYSEWLAAGQQRTVSVAAKAASNVKPSRASGAGDNRVSFEDRKRLKAQRQKLQRELDQIPDDIEKLEAEIERLHAEMNTAAFYDKPAADQAPVFARLKDCEAKLETSMTRWETLEAELESLPEV
ncbi:MAG: ATP-binding cassette domain-containing protein [Pseudomonadales bacterium]|nr:ATP-binding cassette domain-containing protein [Pseudomonadales bacterium]